MAAQQQWLVVLPDHEGAQQKRIDIRPTHLKNVAPSVKSGKVLLGGATLAKPLEEGQPPSMTGSMLIATARTREEVLDFLKQDVYTEANVWDLSKVQITPIRIAVQKGCADLGTEA